MISYRIPKKVDKAPPHVTLPDAPIIQSWETIISRVSARILRNYLLFKDGWSSRGSPRWKPYHSSCGRCDQRRSWATKSQKVGVFPKWFWIQGSWWGWRCTKWTFQSEEKIKIEHPLIWVISQRIPSKNPLCTVRSDFRENTLPKSSLCLQECVHRIIWRRKWGARLTSHLRTHGHHIIVEILNILLKNVNSPTIADYESSWSGSSLATFPGTKDHHCQHSSFSWRPNFRLLTGLYKVFFFW